jgi:hypothetical protein
MFALIAWDMLFIGIDLAVVLDAVRRMVKELQK